MPAPDPAHSSFPSSADLSARVGDIVRATEREARAVEQEIAARRRAAEVSARRYELEARRQTDALAHQRLSRLRSLTDDLAARAQEIRDRLDELLTAIAEASDAVTQGPGDPFSRGLGAPAAEPLDPVWTARGPGSRAAGSDAASGAGGRAMSEPHLVAPRAAPDADAARLVAVELAVSGRTRPEAERHLREAVGVVDPAGLLDDVYGASPAGEAECTASGRS